MVYSQKCPNCLYRFCCDLQIEYVCKHNNYSMFKSDKQQGEKTEDIENGVKEKNGKDFFHFRSSFRT